MNRDRRLKQLREIHLRNKFGITPAQYDEILERQGGMCAVCGAPPTRGISLHVDHDHGTGEIRGLLCFRCNNGIGLYHESTDLLERAASYLNAEPQHRSRTAEWTHLAREQGRALRGSAA